MNQQQKCISPKKTVRLHVRKSDGLFAFMYDRKTVEAMAGSGGRPEIQRMSQVAFNNASQKWEARDNAGQLIAVADSYEECVKKEIDVLDERSLTSTT